MLSAAATVLAVSLGWWIGVQRVERQFPSPPPPAPLRPPPPVPAERLSDSAAEQAKWRAAFLDFMPSDHPDSSDERLARWVRGRTTRELLLLLDDDRWLTDFPRLPAEVCHTLQARDPAVLQRHIEALAPSPARDEVVVLAAQARALADASGALAWAELLLPLNRRTHAIQSVCAAWAGRDPASCLAWIRDRCPANSRSQVAAGVLAAQPGLPEPWRQQLTDLSAPVVTH
jgi:hypothetical protein